MSVKYSFQVDKTRRSVILLEMEGNVSPCTLCKKPFSSLNALQTHMRKDGHPEVFENEAICDYFGKRFGKKANMKRHILSLHEGKMLSCEICSVYVPNERMYNKHMEIHTVKETYYSCKDCDKTFKSKIDFKTF